jgi:Tfp pilus assembly protein PilN
MSVRVNLLPEATKQKDKAAQQRSLVGLAGVLLLAVLGGLYVWATMQVSDAEDMLAAEEATSAQLRGERAELVGFEQLAQRRDVSDQLLVGGLSDEVSVAGVLQDIAAVMPGDAQLDSLTVTVTGAPDPADPEAAISWGSFNMNGQTLTSHAPGVERTLISLDKIVSFRDLYLNSTTLNDPESSVATFSLDGQIGPEAATDRYVDGLPEELR